MPQASVLVDTVLQRMRNPQGVNLNRVLVRQVMTNVQRALNMKRKLVLSSATLTTLPYQVFYSLRPFVPTLLDVSAVREDGRDLHRVNWHQFWYYGRNWHRQVATRFQLCSMVGKELLILWPAKRAASSVEIVFPVETADLEENTDMQVPTEALPLVVDLTHAVLTVAGRNFPPLKALLEVLAARVKVL